MHYNKYTNRAIVIPHTIKSYFQRCEYKIRALWILEYNIKYELLSLRISHTNGSQQERSVFTVHAITWMPFHFRYTSKCGMLLNCMSTYRWLIAHRAANHNRQRTVGAMHFHRTHHTLIQSILLYYYYYYYSCNMNWGASRHLNHWCTWRVLMYILRIGVDYSIH